MQNQIICPNCKKTISNNSVIEDAAKGSGLNTQFIMCDCGERITYWRITALLRDQKKPVYKIKQWLRTLFHSQA